MFVEVEIKISNLLNDLRNGLTWLEKENNGNGSIQQKYEMEDQDVEDIKQHPAFQRTIRTFKIVDDTQKKLPAASVSDVTPVQETLFPEVQETQVELFNDHSTEAETESTGALEFLSL